MVDIASKILLHDKMRFAITVMGVAFAVTLVLVQVGLFIGILDNASITIEKLDADLWITSRNTPNVDFGQTFPESYVQRVRGIPGVRRADNLIVWFMAMTQPGGNQENVVVYAMEDFARWRFPWRVQAGDLNDLRRGPYFFMDDSAARRFGPFAVGQYREILDRRLKIIGRTAEARSFTTTPVAFMNYHRAQALSPDLLRGRTTYIVVKLAEGADLPAVRREIRARLKYNDVYTREEWMEHSRGYWINTTGLGLNMFVTAFLGCLVGVIVVAQTLYASTMEHLREFGTIKAIGGDNAVIYRILAQQAAIAALIGYVLGFAQTLAMGPVVAKMDLKLIVTPHLALAVFAGTVILCILSALIPFRKVASVDPMLVFRG
jgi:putative ABC transport system permease protein